MELFHLNMLMLLMIFWCSFECGIMFLLYGTYPFIKIFWLKMCHGLVGFCSCQAFIMDPEACWFNFAKLWQKRVGKYVLAWYLISWCVATIFWSLASDICFVDVVYTLIWYILTCVCYLCYFLKISSFKLFYLKKFKGGDCCSFWLAVFG